MAELVCNTSPLQYLHQLGLLDLLPALASSVLVPPAVVAELAAGRERGINLPLPEELAWVALRTPTSATALPLVTDLGRGETEVLALVLEDRTRVAVLDDGLARAVAESLGLKLRGTLGLLLDAKRARHIDAVAPVLDRLQALQFRMSAKTRAAVLKLCGEG